MNGYIAFYNGQRVEIHSDSLYAAKLKAIEHFRLPRFKHYLVSVVLAEIDGKQVTHRPQDILP